MIPERTKQIERQTDHLKIIAQYFTDESEAKRESKRAKAIGLVISVAIFLATIWPVLFEGTIYVFAPLDRWAILKMVYFISRPCKLYS